MEFIFFFKSFWLQKNPRIHFLIKPTWDRFIYVVDRHNYRDIDNFLFKISKVLKIHFRKELILFKVNIKINSMHDGLTKVKTVYSTYKWFSEIRNIHDSLRFSR